MKTKPRGKWRRLSPICPAHAPRLGSEVTTPNAHRTHSNVPAFLGLFTVTNKGKFDRPESQQGAAPEFLVNFAVALHSSCYY